MDYFKELSFLIPDFLYLQRKSFNLFLKKGVIDELQRRNPIVNRKKKVKVLFYPRFYQLIVNIKSPNTAIFNSKTYAGQLYLPVQFKNQLELIIYLRF